MWRDSRHDRRPRRVASRRRAMCVREQHAAGRQPIDVRRPCLRMPAQATDPVIEIVDRDEQHVRLVGREGREFWRQNPEQTDRDAAQQAGHGTSKVGKRESRGHQPGALRRSSTRGAVVDEVTSPSAWRPIWDYNPLQVSVGPVPTGHLLHQHMLAGGNRPYFVSHATEDRIADCARAVGEGFGLDAH